MIPDGFQYFLDDFWNFRNVHQIWTRATRIYHQNASKNKRKLGKHPFKNIIVFISHHLGNPKFPDCLALPDITNVELIVIIYFSNLVGPTQLASPSVFKELLGGGILINFGNQKIIKTLGT